MIQSTEHLLVVGASGVLGSAIIDHLAARPGVVVHGVSRRRPGIDAAFEFHAIDLTDAADCAAAVAGMPPIGKMVYAAVSEAEGLAGGWHDPALMARNLDMMTNIVRPVADRGSLSHLLFMQGTKAYGAHVHPIAIPARESDLRDEHENFYWLQEDWVRQQAQQGDWNWTILRPQVVFGGATGVAMNPVIPIGILAAIAQHEGTALRFPGSTPNIHEAVDARLVARACAWAFDTPEARNETFNITNGDLWVLKHMWPRLASALGLEPSFDAPFDIVNFLRSKEDVWARIVARNSLRSSTLGSLLGQSHHYLNLLVAGEDAAPPPALVSTIKIRQAGFDGCFDTMDSMTHWLNVLVARRILPPMGELG